MFHSRVLSSSSSNRRSLFEKGDGKDSQTEITIFANQDFKEKESHEKNIISEDKFKPKKMEKTSIQNNYYTDNDYGYLKIYHELKKDFERIEHMKKFQQFRGKFKLK